VQSISLKNVSLTLYAFHLFKDAETDHLQNADQLWENIAKLSQPFNFPDLKQFSQKILDKSHIDSSFLNLLPCIYEEYQKEDLFCKVIPLKLHDTYAVDFTVYFKNKTISLDDLSCLNPQGCLLPQKINASIGQTLLFYAEIENEVEINEKLAKECVKNLWKTDCPEFIIKRGQLFGSPIFECEEVTNEIPAHILVWFGKNSQTLNLADKSNNYLIQLLCQRHKILLSYSSAQQDYKNTRKLYQQLEEKAESFRDLPQHGTKRLHSLEKMLLTTPVESLNYTKYLRDLNDYKTTLVANRKNYGQSLNNLQGFLLPNDDIVLFELFYKERSVLLEQQINTNLAYLTPAQPLFQQLIDNVQGLTQIETLKHEFDKQERIELLVVFIATTLESAAISAKVDYEHHFSSDLAKHLSTQLPESLNTGLINIAHYVDFIPSFLSHHFSNMFTHIGIGLAFGLFALLLLFLKRKLHSHPSKN